jgi:hypothetical protein
VQDCTLGDFADYEPPTITAAAHFDTDKLTLEGIERYNELMEFLAGKYLKVMSNHRRVRNE